MIFIASSHLHSSFHFLSVSVINKKFPMKNKNVHIEYIKPYTIYIKHRIAQRNPKWNDHTFSEFGGFHTKQWIYILWIYYIGLTYKTWNFIVIFSFELDDICTSLLPNMLSGFRIRRKRCDTPPTTISST